MTWTHANSDRIYGAEKGANRVAGQSRKYNKTRLNVMEQKASEFDRIADACRVLGGDAGREWW
jgi:hypothetical protein